MVRNFDPERTDDENPEWTDAMFAEAVRFNELPTEHQRVLKAVGRPRKVDAKVLMSLRVKPSLMEAYKAKGKGWRLEIERVLTQALSD